MRQGGFPERLFMGLALIVLISALLYAGKWGLASAGHTFSMWHFSDWQKSGKIPDVRTWKWVHEAMYWSLKLDPNNAEYSNDMGRLYAFTAENMTEHESQKEPLLEISLSFFRDAVRLRPSWDRAWANLALIQYRRGIFNAELVFFLNRAMTLGGGVPAVQQIVAEVGVANWRKLPVEMRWKVLNNIHNGLHSLNGRGIRRIIKAYGMKAYFCRILPEPDREMMLCR